MISTPCDAEYDPTDCPPHPARMSLARDLASEGKSGLDSNDGSDTNANI